MGRLLLYTPYTHWTNDTTIASYVTAVFRERGWEVDLLTCGGILGACDIRQASRNPAVAARPKSVICAECRERRNRYAFVEPGNLYQIDDYVERDELDAFSAQIATIDDPAVLRQLESHGCNLYAIAESSLNVHFRRNELTFADPDERRILRQYLVDAWTSLAAADAFFRERSYDAILIRNGRMNTTHAFRQILEQRGIPYFTLDRCPKWGTEGGLALVKQGPSLEHYTQRRPYLEKYRPYSIPAEHVDPLFSIFAAHQKPKGHLSFDHQWKDTKTLARECGISTRYVMLLPSSTDELNVLLSSKQGERPFATQREFIERACEEFSQQHELTLVVRGHPNSGSRVSLGRNEEELRFYRELRDRYAATPTVKVVLPEEPVNTFSLSLGAEAALVYVTSMALELPCYGIPVIEAGRWALQDLPFLTHLESSEILPTVQRVISRRAETAEANAILAIRDLHTYRALAGFTTSAIEWKDWRVGQLRACSAADLVAINPGEADRIFTFLTTGADPVLTRDLTNAPTTTENELRLHRRLRETFKPSPTVPAQLIGPDALLDRSAFLATYGRADVQEVSNHASEGPLVSVIVTAYNHAPFIAKTLDSILAQQVEFPIEICVGEDESTDGTREICVEYAKKHPDRIRLFLGTRANNIRVDGRATGRFNFANLLYHARGRYLAWCEGDDAWSAPDKLARQMAFMQREPGFNGCFHNGQVEWTNTGKRLPYLARQGTGTESYRTLTRDDFGTTDLLSPFSFIPTASLLFRAECIRKLPAWFFQIFSADIALASLLTKDNARLKYLDFDGCVYRKHDGGITAGQSVLDTYFDRRTLYTHLSRFHGHRFDSEFAALVELHRSITTRWLSANRPALSGRAAEQAQRFETNERIAIRTLRDVPAAASVEKAAPVGELPVILVRSHEHNYSETFIEDHVNHLTRNLTLLYGFPFPRFVKGGRSVLPEDAEQRLQLAIAASAITPEIWKDYTSGLSAFFKSCGADAALLESGLMGSFVHAACEQAALPYVVHFHGVDAFGKQLLSQWGAHYRRFFQTAAGVIAVSRAMRRQLISLGAVPERTVLGPYGVAVDLPTLAEPAKAAPQFLAVGRFVDKKAPYATLQAFSLVHQHIPEARLVMVGDGPLLDVCRKLAVKNGVAHAVSFLGVQSRETVSRLMAESRAFVQHSVTAENGDSEGLPLAILEAGAHGLPVISTQHAGIPDAVRNGVDGFLVPEKDIRGMAAAIHMLAQDADLAARLGASFRERVLSHYSRRRSIERLLAVLQAAATGQPVGGLGDEDGEPESLPSTEPVAEAAPPASSGAVEPDAPTAAEPQHDARAAIGADRNNRDAYLKLARELADRGDIAEAYIAAGEAHRLGSDSSDTQAMLASLENLGALGEPAVETYRRRAGWLPRRKNARPRRILVVTNLLPPQEMGGFGRTMSEFGRELVARGHTVRVLTSDMPHLLRKKTPEHEVFEPHVRRTLKLFGDWRDGAAVLEPNRERLLSIIAENHHAILAEARRFRPEIVIAGNLDLLGFSFLQEFLDSGLPVLHRLGNAGPGYAAADGPRSPLYCLAGCSEWVNDQLRTQGYPISRYAVLPPGSPLTDYYRAFPPRRDRLRIAFASLLMPYKGAHLLVEALGYLKKVGIDFECTLAGDTTSPGYVEEMRNFAAAHGFLDRLHFPGFLSNTELGALFARTNVLVFPSVFDEPFGKTQIEAMAAGLLVISSGNGGAKEIIRDGDTGLFFPSGDARALAERLAQVHQQPELAAKVAAAGQADAFRFTTGACVDRLESLLDELIGAARKPVSRPVARAR